jgi:methyl-accepting chemotaxis protein
MVGAALFLYVVLILGLAMAVPVVGAAWDLRASGGELAAHEFIVLAEVWWPAFVALLIGALIVAWVFTRRVGGPLYRLDQTIGALAAGQLGIRLRFRRTDHAVLHELAATFNRAIDGLEAAVSNAVAQRHAIDLALAELAPRVPDRDAEAHAALAQIRAASAALDRSLQPFETGPARSDAAG